jgi:hypothetical protein
MPSFVPVATALCWAGAVTYLLMHIALSKRNQTMGFTGDFEAAAASCLKVSLLMRVAAGVGTVVSCAPTGGLRAIFRVIAYGRTGKKARRRAFDDEIDDEGPPRDAVLPGAYQMRRR